MDYGNVGDDLAKGFWGCVILVAVVSALISGLFVWGVTHMPYQIKIEKKGTQ